MKNELINNLKFRMKKMKFYCVILSALLITNPKYSQSQEEILRDLREDNVPSENSILSNVNGQIENLQTIYQTVKAALEAKDDLLAIKEANKMETSGFNFRKEDFKGYSELSEIHLLVLKIRKLRAEAYYNLRKFNLALPDSKFIVENHPKPVVFDYTRFAVSLFYLGHEQQARRVLVQAKEKLRNENDLLILKKTETLLFQVH